jgi:hypothetical protein
MPNFVEQATLEVIDKSSPKIKKINSSINQLMRTVRGFRGKQLDIGIKGNPVGELRKASAELSRLRKSALRPITVQTRVQRLPASLGAPGGRTAPSSVPIVPRQNPNSIKNAALGFKQGNSLGTSIAAGLKQSLRPLQFGRDIGRGFNFAISGELYQVGRNIVLTTGSAPANLDDARARVRISGRNEKELQLIEGVAKRLTEEFQTVTKADIIANSGEVTGRFGDLTDPKNFQKASNAMERLAKNTQILQAALANGGTGGAANQARLVETAIQQVGATGDKKFADEISKSVLRAVIGSGGDLQAGDVKRTLQQIPTARAGIGSGTLLTALLLRDEGGRRSSGNLNQLFSDTIRGNLNNDDFASQLKQGIRNKDGSSDVFAALQTDVLKGTANEIIPRLKKLGVQTDFTKLQRGTEEFSSAVGKLRAAIDNDLGFSKQGGVAFLSDLIVNFDEIRRERKRAEKANPEFALTNPTIRQELTAVNSQFQNVAATALKPLLPVVKGSLDSLSDVLNSVQSGEAATTAQLATAGIAAGPLALSAGLQAALDPQTRALGLSSIALTGSATALTGSAAALTTAAGLNAVSGAGADGKGGRFKSLRAFAALVGIPAAAFGAKELGEFASNSFGRNVLGRSQAEQNAANKRADESSRKNARIMIDAAKSFFSGSTNNNQAGEFATQTPKNTKVIQEQVKAEGLNVIKSMLQEVKTKSLTNPNSPTLKQEALSKISEARSIASDISLNAATLDSINAEITTIQQAFGLSTQTASTAANQIETGSQTARAAAQTIANTPDQIAAAFSSGAQQVSAAISSSLANGANVTISNQSQNQPDLGATSLASE